MLSASARARLLSLQAIVTPSSAIFKRWPPSHFAVQIHQFKTLAEFFMSNRRAAAGKTTRISTTATVNS
jgi:hypothetical protein